LLVLAIDTSGQAISASLLENGKVLLELNSKDDQPENSESDLVKSEENRTSTGAGSDDVLPAGYTKKRSKRGSKTSRVFPPGASVLLAPMLKKLTDQCGVTFDQIGLIALPTGPGLFTGIRVGVVSGKSLAYSTQADLIGVNTLEVIAAQTAIQEDWFGKPICAVLNAQRQQLFTGQYISSSPWKIESVAPNQTLTRSRTLTSLLRLVGSVQPRALASWLGSSIKMVVAMTFGSWSQFTFGLVRPRSSATRRLQSELMGVVMTEWQLPEAVDLSLFY